MKPLPRISIVTPSLNQARFLAETMDSIMSQDYPELEYIVIDGKSTDGSQRIIEARQQYLSDWCDEEDRGQSDAIMKGLARSSGELFAWVNSDDILFPGCLAAVAKCYLKNNRPDIIHTNVAYIDAETRITRYVRVPRQSRFFFFRGVWHGAAPSIFFKTSLVRAVGGLDRNLHLSMDLDLWMKMMKAGAKAAHVPEYLGGFRQHASSKTVVSIISRKTFENPETARILDGNLSGSTILKRMFWRRVYHLCQILNLNYMRARRDLRRHRNSPCFR
jgi:glycosyltransferase involved in cell wall biosynthesis